jgi:hypothetical protein
MTNRPKWLALAVLALAAATALAQTPASRPSAGPEDLNTTIEALKARLRDQNNRLAELEAQQAKQTASMAQIAKDMAADAGKRGGGGSPWLEDLKFAGDVRLRYEYNGFNWGAAEDSEKKDRNRARFRVRFGVIKTWLDDQLEVGFRLASGENNDATSTNQSFTQDFSKKPVWIDLAYAKYAPKDLKGLAVTGGKMLKPWVENEIFFDTDVNPEGFWAEYKAPKMGPFEPFVGAGYFIVNESAADEDSTMYIVQAGVRAEIAKDVKYTFAANYQEWTHFYASGATPRGNDSPLSNVPGFGVINLTNNVEVASVLGRPLSFMADFAHNCGEADEARARYEGQNNAFAAGIKYGQNKKMGDWSVKYRYAVVEANALPGHFVDSDFGFANRKGHVIGAEYNVRDSLTVGVQFFLTQPIFSPTTTSGSTALEDLTATILADMVWKF